MAGRDDWRWTVGRKLIMSRLVLLWLLSVSNGIWRVWAVSPPDASLDDAVALARCRTVSTVTSGTFDEYYALADMGNRPTERHLVNVSVEVAVRSRQEELAVLLSSEDRSHQYPDFAHTYEMRLTNVYTVLYRETVKLQAYHSPQDKLFPGERFRLRFLVRHDGRLEVLADADGPPRTLLTVVDPLPPLEPRYISFASRMNAYPVRFALGCDLPPDGDTSTTEQAGDGGAGTTVDPPGTGCPVCPVCVKQRCQVVVRACADSNRDAPEGAGDEQEQRYYFYFNMYLQKNKTKSLGPVGPVGRSP